VSGNRGDFPQWTPLPAHFRNNGFLTLGTGKYYHPGGSSRGSAASDDKFHPGGNGKPPLADRDVSWTNAGPNGTVQFPDQRIYQEKWGAFHSGEFGPYGNFQYLNPDDEVCKASYCTVDWNKSGTPPSPPEKGQVALGDFVTYQDAINKMQYAAGMREMTGQPFFLVVGIKRPHLGWRMPKVYADMFPSESVEVPSQLTLDESIDPIAYSVFPMKTPFPLNDTDFVTSPFVHGSTEQLQALRQHYYAAVAWADYAAGQVLQELDRLRLTNDTMVILHSDHGWHLGEYAMFEKRTNWELGTRVPLIMRIPWLRSSIGQRSNALVELVDIYPTICDIMGLELPLDTVPFDGVSLWPLLNQSQKSVKPFALSTFPRCAHIGMPEYGQRGLPNGQDNSCLNVERTDFTWMGYTMRTDRWRYTEWVSWNGSSLSPIWSQLKSSELYDHQNDTGAWTNADKFENINLVNSVNPSIVQALSTQLHVAFGFPDTET
jgi:hypothetical protein